MPTLLMEIGTNAWDLVSSIDWLGLGQIIIDTIVEGIDALFNAIPDVLESIGEAGIDFITGVDWWGVGSDIVNGIISGIQSMGSALWNALTGIAQSALNSVKKLLKIGSPSRVFADEVGKWIPEGVAVGIEANTQSMTDAMKDMAMDAASVPVEQIVNADRTWSAEQAPAQSVTTINGVTITIDASKYDGDPIEIAQATVDLLTNHMDREEAVFA